MRGQLASAVRPESAVMIDCFPLLSKEPSPRCSGPSIPVGWTPCFGIRRMSASEFSLAVPVTERLDSDHCVYRCPHKEYFLKSNMELELRRCSVCVRKSRIKDHVSQRDGSAVRHEYKVEARYDAMLFKSCVNSVREERMDIYSAELLKCTATLAGSLGISLASCCSDAMEAFLHDVLNMAFKAQRNAQTRNITLTADDFNYHHKRDNMRDEICRLAVAEKGKRVDYARENGLFVTLKIDSGTVLRNHCMHGVLDTTLENEANAIVLEVEENVSWNMKAYEDYLGRKVKGIEELGLTLSAIVHDGLPAQAGAVRNFVANVRPEARILDVSCFSHMTNLVFTSCNRESTVFSRWTSEVMKWQRVLRAARVKCPTVPLTRWLYIVEVLDHIIKSKEKIRNVVKASADLLQDVATYDPGDGSLDIPQEFYFLFSVISPLMKFSKEIEKSSTALADIIPLAVDLLNSWWQIKNNLEENDYENHDEIFHMFDVLVTCFLARLANNSFGEACTAYILSGRGKRDFVASGKSDILRVVKIRRSVAAENEESRPPDVEGSEACAEISTVCDVTEADLMNELAEGPNHGEEQCFALGITSSLREKMNRLQHVALDEKLNPSMILHDLVPLAAKAMCEVGRFQDRDVHYYECLISEWLRSPLNSFSPRDEPFGYLEHRKSWDLWCHHYAMALHGDQYAHWREFSDDARRFVATGAREATAERMISQQRHIYGGHTTRIDYDLITERLTLYTGHKKVSHPVTVQFPGGAEFLDLVRT